MSADNKSNGRRFADRAGGASKPMKRELLHDADVARARVEQVAAEAKARLAATKRELDREIDAARARGEADL